MSEPEFYNALKEYNAKVFLISGGGNDLLGGGRLATLIRPFDASFSPSQYLNREFEKALNDLEYLYERLFKRLNEKFPDLHVICHGYDYAIPGEFTIPFNTGIWLKKPMESLDIIDEDLQRKIIIELMDEFNKMLENVSKNHKNIRYVNLRDTVNNNEWFDELHP
ncbi:MAG: peptidase C14, caspase catalytic subunit p20, partial [Planctomycetes bacterium]|nr:peptidase C14, caspase catalytic subunit p20 [Planctomycetota bacterium]